MSKESVKNTMKQLIDSGYFGEKSKSLFYQKDGNEKFIGYIDSIFDIYKNDDTQHVFLGFFEEFWNLFQKAKQKDKNKLLRVLDATFEGTKDNENVETLSSYSDLMEANVSYNDILTDFNKKIAQNNINLADKIKMARSMKALFAKGYEYCSKLFTFVLNIQKINMNKKINLENDSRKFGSQKIKEFSDIDNNQYPILINNWNKTIRNAESHINLVYNPDDGIFEGKEIVKNDTINFSVGIIELQAEIFHNAVFMHGYLVAYYLIMIQKTDENLCNEVIKNMYQ